MAPQTYEQLQQGDDEASLFPGTENTCVECRKHARKERVIDIMILLNLGLFLLSVVAISLLLGISSTGKYILSRRADPSLPDAVYCKCI